MKKKEIRDMNHRLATKVMGWEIKQDIIITGLPLNLLPENWNPHSNISQALMVADRLCEKNGWARQSKYRPSGKYYKFYFFDDITYPTESHHEVTADTEVEAVYKALCAAIDILTP